MIGTFKVNCALSDGRTVSAGNIQVQPKSTVWNYKLMPKISNGTGFELPFSCGNGLQAPTLSNKKFNKEPNGECWGSVDVTNPNSMELTCAVSYKASASSSLVSKGSHKIEANKTLTINYSGIYYSGFCLRYSLVNESMGIGEGEACAFAPMGSYSGSDF